MAGKQGKSLIEFAEDTSGRSKTDVLHAMPQKLKDEILVAHRDRGISTHTILKWLKSEHNIQTTYSRLTTFVSHLEGK